LVEKFAPIKKIMQKRITNQERVKRY